MCWLGGLLTYSTTSRPHHSQARYADFDKQLVCARRDCDSSEICAYCEIIKSETFSVLQTVRLSRRELVNLPAAWCTPDLISRQRFSRSRLVGDIHCEFRNATISERERERERGKAVSVSRTISEPIALFAFDRLTLSSERSLNLAWRELDYVVL